MLDNQLWEPYHHHGFPHRRSHATLHRLFTFPSKYAAPGEDERAAADNGLQRGVRGRCHSMAIEVVHVVLERAVPVARGYRQRLSRVQQTMSNLRVVLPFQQGSEQVAFLTGCLLLMQLP